MMFPMSSDVRSPIENGIAENGARRSVAMHLQAIESNPVTEEEIALFEMFDEKGWSTDQRIAHLRKLANANVLVPAAE